MKSNRLAIECDDDGSSAFRIWCDCQNSEDVDDLIAWLELAKTLMIKWEEIRQKDKEQ